MVWWQCCVFHGSILALLHTPPIWIWLCLFVSLYARELLCFILEFSSRGFFFFFFLKYQKSSFKGNFLVGSLPWSLVYPLKWEGRGNLASGCKRDRILRYSFLSILISLCFQFKWHIYCFLYSFIHNYYYYMLLFI